MTSENQNAQQKSRRGFAAMSPERQREIASQGGKAAHIKGVAHEWNQEAARQAGKKGGLVSGKKRASERDGNETFQ